jgi:hypothetical protein
MPHNHDILFGKKGIIQGAPYVSPKGKTLYQQSSGRNAFIHYGCRHIRGD